MGTVGPPRDTVGVLPGHAEWGQGCPSMAACQVARHRAVLPDDGKGKGDVSRSPAPPPLLPSMTSPPSEPRRDGESTSHPPDVQTRDAWRAPGRTPTAPPVSLPSPRLALSDRRRRRRRHDEPPALPVSVDRFGIKDHHAGRVRTLPPGLIHMGLLSRIVRPEGDPPPVPSGEHRIAVHRRRSTPRRPHASEDASRPVSM